jgi:hypothetical protein
VICPCKDCNKKGCGDYHSQCKEYQAFAEWRKYVNETQRKEKEFSFNIKERREKWKKKR